jgi:hypothetical protein
LFWDQHDDVLGLKVVRFQASGLCYMHAPVVLQHYLVAIQTKAINHEMIDIAKFIVNEFTCEELENHIIHNKGGNSIQFLRRITDNSELELSIFNIPPKSNPYHGNIVTFVMNAMKSKSVPALVSGFRCAPKFQNPNGIASFSGCIDEPVSMVLVGFRTDSKGNVFFLLQNWWRSKPFVEVSAEYMTSSHAFIVFVHSKLESIPQSFSLTHAHCVETSVDMAECLTIDG